MLQEKVAIITGGGQGIGLAIALAYARAGAKVVLASRSLQALTQTQATIEQLGAEVLAVPTDVCEQQSVHQMVEQAIAHFGHIDVLVNNAGIAGPTKPLWEIDPSEWDATIAVNQRGVYLCCHAVLPFMIQQRKGCILNIGSGIGKKPLVGRTPYATSKLGIIGLTRTLAWDVAPYNIRVNVISPGPVESPRLEAVLRKQAEIRNVTFEEVRRMATRDAPLARFVTAEEIAAVAVFLASDATSAITGEDVNVSAGLVME